MLPLKIDDTAEVWLPEEDSEEMSSLSPHAVTADYADGKAFPSVLTPIGSLWTLFPVTFMISFLFLWMFRAKFWQLYGYLDEKIQGDAARSEWSSKTPESDPITKLRGKESHFVRL